MRLTPPPRGAKKGDLRKELEATELEVAWTALDGRGEWKQEVVHSYITSQALLNSERCVVCFPQKTLLTFISS